MTLFPKMAEPPAGRRQITIVVTGGRDYYSARDVNNALDALHAVREVRALWHGGARGADWLAGQWAARHPVDVRVIPITGEDWKRYGKKAGPFRNAQLLSEAAPDLVVAFPGGRGTGDMVKRARMGGVPVWEPYGEENKGDDDEYLGV